MRPLWPVASTVKRTREQIFNSDLLPFRAAIEAGVDIVMTAHLLYPAFDEEWPATLSPAILQGLLRKELGFQGVILTDSFSMGAIRRVFGAAPAATRAINAGVCAFMSSIQIWPRPGMPPAQPCDHCSIVSQLYW